MPIHALLVGLDRYHPAASVPPLQGAVNDLHAFEALLRDRFDVPAANIRLLTNATATRAAVEAAFLEQLCHNPALRPGDTALFYFAGHGSRRPSAAPFRAFDGEGHDELLLLYDGRLPGHFDLSDKELAHLLARIPDFADPLLIVDSCHSAHLTRSSDVQLRRRRFAPTEQSPRALADYTLAGDRLYPNPTTVAIPTRPHVQLAACARDQEAWETDDDRGLFSRELERVLRAHSGPLTLHELTARLRLAIDRRTRQNRLQTPVLHTYQSSPHRFFLRSGERKRATDAFVSYSEGHWWIDRGVIHALPENRPRAVRIHVHARPDRPDAGPTVALEQIHLERSQLPPLDLDRTQIYPAEIVDLPDPLRVRLEGRPTDALPAIAGVLVATDMPRPDYIVSCTGTDCRLLDGLCQNQLHRFTLARTAAALSDFLEQLVNWHRLGRLHPISTDGASAKLLVVVDFPDQTTTPTERSFRFVLQPSERQKFRVRVKNPTGQALYLAGLGSGSDFRIDTIIDPQRIDAHSDWVTVSDAFHVKVDADKGENTDVLQVLVGDKPLVVSSWSQRGIRTRSFGRNDAAELPVDWAVHTFTFHCIRATDITPPVRLNGASGAGGQLQLTAFQNGAGETHPLALLRRQLPEGMALLDLATPGSRSVGDRSVVSITHLPVSLTDATSDLGTRRSAERGLTVNIDPTLVSDADEVLAVTVSDGLLWPLGAVTSAGPGSDAQLHLAQLPPETDRIEPGRRSLGRALWFCLLKSVGRADLAFRLRRLTGYDEEGRPVREAVHAADLPPTGRFLLCLHGIIGDTSSILRPLRGVFERREYAAMLCFDYENLHTPIESTARRLRDELTTLGFAADDGRQLDIVVHSMGGLVSRYYIEQLGGDRVVNRLLMFGTPNAGSVFGQVPRFRDRLLALTTIVLNTGGTLVPSLIPVLKVVEKVLAFSKPLTVALAQMGYDSPFLKELNTPAPTAPRTEYQVIGGDITDYRSTTDARLQRILEQLTLRIGELAYRDGNDIAVDTDDILAVTAAVKQRLSCHHLNYFDYVDSVEILENWLEAGRGA